jgi:hypothetical protein
MQIRHLLTGILEAHLVRPTSRGSAAGATLVSLSPDGTRILTAYLKESA